MRMCEARGCAAHRTTPVFLFLSCKWSVLTWPCRVGFTCDYICTMTLISSQIHSQIECITTFPNSNIFERARCARVWVNRGRRAFSGEAVKVTLFFPCRRVDFFFSVFFCWILRLIFNFYEFSRPSATTYSHILLFSSDFWRISSRTGSENSRNFVIHIELYSSRLSVCINAIIAIEMS